MKRRCITPFPPRCLQRDPGARLSLRDVVENSWLRLQARAPVGSLERKRRASCPSELCLLDAQAAPPPAPAAAPTTTVRGKKRGPVKGATAKADSKIRMVFAPMRTWYGAPARAALKKKHGAYPATPEALANWKSFGPVTTAFLDDQGVAPGPTAAAPAPAARATKAGTRSKWHGWR